jgi:hypothetical protein
MPELIWGNPLDKRYESGLDKGVLYLPDGSAVPWNGLISVSEKFKQDSETVYFDGMKISVIVSSGDFEATLKAASYPKEFDEIQGYANLRKGVKLRDQIPQFFGMSWRTFKGNEAQGPEAAYKVNVAYNLIATPSDREHETKSDDPSLVEMEWELASVPEELPGFRPTAHFIIESDEVDPWLLEEIEKKLYGTFESNPYLPQLSDLLVFMRDWARMTIVDHGDGTWTATELRPNTYIFQSEDDPDVYELRNANAIWVVGEVDEKYVISDVTGDPEKLEIRVNDDGTWVAISEDEIQVTDGVFTLTNVNPVFSGPDMFRLKSQS